MTEADRILPRLDAPTDFHVTDEDYAEWERQREISAEVKARQEAKRAARPTRWMLEAQVSALLTENVSLRSQLDEFDAWAQERLVAARAARLERESMDERTELKAA